MKKILSNNVKAFLVDLAVDLGISFTKLAYDTLTDKKSGQPRSTKLSGAKTSKTPIRKKQTFKRRRK